MAYITETFTSGKGLAQRIAEIRETLTERAARYRVYRTTRRELDALDNRELADLGIHRSMIKRLALEAAYGTK